MIYAIDFGTGDALAVFGQDGAIPRRALKLARVNGGRTPAMEFIMVAEALMTGGEFGGPGDLVVESATIGASGCEVDDVIDLLQRHPVRCLYTISNRAVKNYRADHKLEWHKGARYARDGSPPPRIMSLYEQAEVHVEDAEIIYRIATEYPERLYLWEGPSFALQRKFTSVRPMDKRGYRDERSEQFMRLLPPYEMLPPDLREVLGDGEKYSRSMVMPFAMATQEPHIDDGPLDDRRQRYEKVIGLYDRGYPSFYRRATIVWMQKLAKRLAGTTKNAEVPPDVRKEAWRLTQRQVRRFFHLSMQHQGR